MPAFSLTEEQEAIVSAVRDTIGNVAVVAYAGSGKTATIVAVAEAMRERSALCLAFNKSIATEMTERLPDHCVASTLNSLGHRAWSKTINGQGGRKKIWLDRSKNFNLLKEVIENLPLHEQEDMKGSAFIEVLNVITEAKRHGYLPPNVIPGTTPVIDDPDAFFESVDYILSEVQMDVVDKVVIRSFREAQDGHIDFDDQILCPTIYDDAGFQQYPITLVDEAQDLSSLNHRMLEKIVGNNRLVIVGDPFQAIYGFRGAHEESMAQLIAQYDMAEFKLTMSFRSDQAIIENAQWRAPDMRWTEGAAGKGEVRFLETWSDQDISDDSAVLCRNNAPLFSCALSLLQAGRRPELKSGDIIKQLVKILESLGDRTQPKELVLGGIDQWRKKTKKSRRNHDSVDDTAQCLMVLADQCETLQQTIALATRIGQQKGRINLSTIHRSKGLEYDKVYILDVGLISGSGQDPNVRYVGETRARHTLNYIETEHYVPLAEITEGEEEKISADN